MKEAACLMVVGSILDTSSDLFESGGLWLLMDCDDWEQVSPLHWKI